MTAMQSSAGELPDDGAEMWADLHAIPVAMEIVEDVAECLLEWAAAGDPAVGLQRTLTTRAMLAEDVREERDALDCLLKQIEQATESGPRVFRLLPKCLDGDPFPTATSGAIAAISRSVEFVQPQLGDGDYVTSGEAPTDLLELQAIATASLYELNYFDANGRMAPSELPRNDLFDSPWDDPTLVSRPQVKRFIQARTDQLSSRSYILGFFTIDLKGREKIPMKSRDYPALYLWSEIVGELRAKWPHVQFPDDPGPIRAAK